LSALTANANSVQILSESADHLMVRLFLYQFSLGNQNSQLVVNVETLAYRTQLLTVNPAARFVPSDVITGSLSAAQAAICYNISANTILVTNLTGNTAGFETNDVLSGSREGSPGTGTQPTTIVTAVVNPPRVLAIDSIQWTVTGANASVGLEFANSSAFDTAIMLSGTDYFGRNELNAAIKPNPLLVGGNGNLYISTYNVLAGGGYSITLSLHKVSGFASPAGY
jgi:hypothetical protein